MDEKELLLYGEIGPEYFGMISDTAVIRALDDLKGARKITVRINSPGGDAFMGVSIMNAFRRHQAKITVHVDALAASAASIAAMGGDKIVMHEGAMLMIHRAWTIGMGNATDFAKIADTLAKVDDNIIDIYHRKSGLDREKVKRMVDEETWMSGSEAVEFGLADEVDHIATGLSAKIPEGWYNRAPKQVGRYTLDNRQAAALTGLAVAARVQPTHPDHALQERLRQRLSAA